jgi:hypothetical protein
LPALRRLDIDDLKLVIWQTEATVERSGASMPPRAPKVPFSSGGHPPLAIPDNSWERIEAAYGRELPTSVRDAILDATARFVDMASAEKGAGSALPGRIRIDRLRKLASNLLKEIDKRNSFPPEAPQFYADELIFFHLQHPSGNNKDLHPSGWRELLAPVAADLSRFIAACDEAKREMQETKTPGYWPEGSAWNAWIVELIGIMKAHGLTTAAAMTVTKHSDDRYSPFVGFMRALQSCVPPDLQRSMDSDGALAEAIKRARRGASAGTH